jgi:uncharacterized membrane protein
MMSKEMRRFLLYAVLMMIGFAVLIFTIVPRLNTLLSTKTQEGQRIGLGENMFQAEIVEIVEQGEVTLGEIIQTYQVLRVEIIEGPWQGEIQQIDYGRRQVRPEGLTMRVGDRVLVQVDQLPDGTVNAFFVDYVRTRSLVWLLLAFIIFSILVGRSQGMRGLLGLLLSLWVIMSFIIPGFCRGTTPPG